MWKNVDHAMLKQAWAEDLAGLKAEEIKTGLEACKTKPWPPSLPEFIELCRPELDYEALYHHANAQMFNRHNNYPENWKSKADLS